MQRHNPFLPARPRYVEPKARCGCTLVLAALFGAIIGGCAVWSAVIGPDSTPPIPTRASEHYRKAPFSAPTPRPAPQEA